MIDYSVYMMKNQMKPEEPAKAYAKNQVRGAAAQRQQD